MRCIAAKAMVIKMKNLAIIGYGAMGGWHAEKAQNSDAVNLIGIYDIDPERITLAKSQGIKAYASLGEVLDDKCVDIVSVVTPNDSHKEIAIKALLAGKNVICEKPVTISASDLEEMLNTANKAGKLLTVHQNRRWDSEFLMMKKLYESGEIGEIFSIESRVHGSHGIPSGWRCERKYGGGMLYDWGIHLIDQILMIVPSEIDTVFCRLDNLTNDEVDDGFRLELMFKNGCRAHIEVGTYNFISLPRFYMQGKNGTAIIGDWGERCKVVKCTAFHESEITPVETAAGLTKTMAPRDSVTVSEHEYELPPSDSHDFYRNFARAIDGAESQLITHDQMMLDLKVVEAAFRSAKQSEVIKF